MDKYYITFGQNHAYAIAGKTFDKDCVAVIEAVNYKEGRILAFEIFSSKFAFFYEEMPEMDFYHRGLIKCQ